MSGAKAPSSSARRQFALGGLAGAGLAFGVVDALLGWTRETSQLSAGDAGAGLLIVAASTTAAVFLVGAPIALGLSRAGSLTFEGSRTRLILALLTVVALGALIFDKWAFVHRYPYFHTLLALGYSALVGFVGVAIGLRRASSKLASAGLASALPVALAGLILAPGFFADRPALRAGVPDWSTWTRLASPLWEPPAPEAGDTSFAGLCEFPPALPVPASAQAPARGYNLLWLSMDAVRGDLGGDALAQTWPELHAALPGAFRFDRVYSAGTRTTESIYAMLTGRWPHELDFRPSVVDQADHFRVLADDDPRALDPQSWRQHHPLPIEDPHPTLPALLNDAGYHTGGAGASLFFLPQAGITRDFAEMKMQAYEGTRAKRFSGSFSAPAMSDGIIEVIDEAHAAKRPFFAWGHYIDPHAPYDLEDGQTQDDPRARQLAEIHRADREMARVLAHLDALGQLERTLVIITSDHGEEFRDHGGLLHGTTVYNELLHVPLLLRLPGVKGRPIDAPVSLVDLVPTTLHLLGVQSPLPFSGRVWTELLGLPGPRTDWKSRPILGLSSLHKTLTAVIQGDDKLIEHDSGAVELFDLAKDPQERRNIAGERPERLNELRCLLRAAGAR